MLGSLDEPQFFQVIIQLMRCKRCIEIGTFTGYTSLIIALALSSDGQLTACDISEQYIPQNLWEKAENGPGSFDFIFIDADKTNYMNDYQLAVELIRSDGLIAIDNTLWDGKVIDLSDTNEDTIAIREINDFVRDDQRIDISFLRFGDETTLCRKK